MMKTRESGDSTGKTVGNALNLKRDVFLGDTPAETMWCLIGLIVNAASDGGLPRERCDEILDDLGAGLTGLDGGRCVCEADGCAGHVNLDDVSWSLFTCVERLTERNRELYARLGGND